METVIFESLLIAFPPGQQLSNKSLALSIDSEMIFSTAKAINIFLSLSTSANLSKNFVWTFLHSKKSSYFPISLLSI